MGADSKDLGAGTSFSIGVGRAIRDFAFTPENLDIVVRLSFRAIYMIRHLPPGISAAIWLATLSASGCGCPSQSQVEMVERAGGTYLEGTGYHGACNTPSLWFDKPIDDDTFARLHPAIERMAPTTLQLSGQRGITDRSVQLINRLESVQVLLLDGSGITSQGMSQLRPDIRVDHGSGYQSN
jgi:hypothetical protein